MAKVMRGCELVYHCAATAYEGLSVFAPAMIMDNIVTGSVAVFSAAIAGGARRIVFCSSMARYGTNAVPFLEAYDPRPQDPYGIAKVAAEQALRQPRRRARAWNTPSRCRTTSSARGRNSTTRTATSPPSWPT